MLGGEKKSGLQSVIMPGSLTHRVIDIIFLIALVIEALLVPLILG